MLEIKKWDIHWAVYCNDELVCLTVYKKAALEVLQRLRLAYGDTEQTS